tara:strand:- start:506 stop:835 length:330 start_codon:yes stop_codon:yes gene_type:complete
MKISIKAKKEIDRNEAISKLKEVLKKGDTLFTNVTHVSKSGMTRNIRVMKINNNRPVHLNKIISVAMDWPIKDNAIRVGGCGMDMGFHLVYTLGSILFNNGYSLKQEWI